MAKCPYCDFNSHVSANIDQNRWKRAYLAEIDRVGAQTSDRVLSTVFFGGGTPSLMSADLVATIMEKITETWTIANDFEVTLEANPTSVEADRFRGYRDAGVSRVSLGIQALNDDDLKALGRMHSMSEALAAYDTARSVFDRTSFDLIYARQNQDLKAWEQELQRALALDPSHMSLYQLTIEDGTAFGDRFYRGKLAGLPGEDLGADLYEATQTLCGQASLGAYEVSNHAKSGQECRHNLIYWNSGDYAGIGPGAHGRLSFADARYATETHLSPAKWLLDVETNGSGESVCEALDSDAFVKEALMMGLRTSTGVDLDRIRVNTSIAANIGALIDDGFLQSVSNHVTVTPAGRPILNAVLRHIFDD